MRPLLLLILLSFAMCAACSSSTTTNGGSNTASIPRSSSPETSGSPAAANDDSSVAATNAESDNSNLSDRMARLRHRPTNVDHPGPPAPLEYRPAPENSQIATTMNADGQPMQVRVFRTDPRVARVEAIWLGPKEKQFKITLRNGKTVDVKTDKIADLASVSAADLAALAGGSK
jgi:hypothetical protein